MNNVSNKLLLEILREIQISKAQYENAETRYTAIGEWLNRKESTIARFNPRIYPQGSFLLGTAIKPTSGADEYDIDLICDLSLSKEKITQEQLKTLIGHEIKAYAKSRGFAIPVAEKTRCWTIEYSDGSKFHIDILPAIPDDRILLEYGARFGDRKDYFRTGIAITDNTRPEYASISQNWPVSNPKGLNLWFRSRMQIQLAAEAKRMMESVEKLPTTRASTTLQKAIKVLKYLRNKMFEGMPDEEFKPISIIITTLATHAYGNEESLAEALRTIVGNLHLHMIRGTNGQVQILNPVNPGENFADKWALDPRYEKAFLKWLGEMRAIFGIEYSDRTLLRENFSRAFGRPVVEKAIASLASTSAPAVLSAAPSNITPVTKPWGEIRD